MLRKLFASSLDIPVADKVLPPIHVQVPVDIAYDQSMHYFLALEYTHKKFVGKERGVLEELVVASRMGE